MNIIIDYLLGEKKSRYIFNNYKILMIGLSGSGKTSILNLLTKFKIEETIPTVKSNIDIIKYDNYNFTIIDVGGQEKMIPLWNTFYNNIDGIIYVLDSSDQSKYEINKKALNDVLNSEQTSQLPIVILANKSENCQKNLQHLIEYFNLQFQNDKRPWDIQYSSILQRTGICEGLDFLKNNIKKKNN